MKVLVAGLSKTGTKTMAAALRHLGYEVYDWMENFWYLGDDWQRQVREGFKTEDLRRMYENVDAVTATPCNNYWEEFFDAFPDVKVVMTTRDDESWVKSWKNHVDRLNNDWKFRLARTITYTGIKAHFFLVISGDCMETFQTWRGTRAFPKHDETLKKVKARHERNIKQIVPQKQLLVFEVKEGWKPLCDFLGVPVPKIPFPHKNKSTAVLDEMREENIVMQRIETELKLSLACLVLIFAGLVFKAAQIMWW